MRRADHRPAFTWFVDPPQKNQPPSWETQPPMHSCGRPNPVTSTPCSSTTPASTLESISAPSIDLQVNDQDHLLKVYREYYAANFPFVIIPPNTTSKELAVTRPWLAITVSMVACHENRNQQMALAKQIIMEVSSALFVRCERSLDMLEGLIIYNVWLVILPNFPHFVVTSFYRRWRQFALTLPRQFYYSPLNPQYQSAAVVQLALAVLFDLGLNKPLREIEGPDMVADTFRLTADKAKEIRRSSEERRAFLSCYILTSTYAIPTAVSWSATH